MALTPQEKEDISKALDKLDRDALDKILSSPEDFFDWLKKTSYSSYLKLKDSSLTFELMLKVFCKIDRGQHGINTRRKKMGS
jgi:hypothetical protein